MEEQQWEDNSPEAESARPQNDDLRVLRDKAKRFDQNADEAAAAKRELVFLKAGIDTDSKQGQLLMRSYEGDLTLDAIKSYQSEIFGTPTTPPEPEYKDEAAAAAARQALATGGEVPSSPSTPDPYTTAAQAKDKAINSGKGRDEALADGFRVLLQAASDGDPRVEVGRNRP